MAEKTYSERLKPSGNSFKDAFASAKKAGKKEFTWKGRDYTTVTKEEREKSFKRETRREKYKRKDTSRIDVKNSIGAKSRVLNAAGINEMV